MQVAKVMVYIWEKKKCFYQNEIHRTFKPKCTSDCNGIELEKVNGSVIAQSSLHLSVVGLAKEARELLADICCCLLTG